MKKIANVWQQLYGEDLATKPIKAGQVRVHCPFHRDHNPSCDVHLDKDTFLCRSCGTGGGILTLVQRELGISGESVKAWLRAH